MVNPCLSIYQLVRLSIGPSVYLHPHTLYERQEWHDECSQNLLNRTNCKINTKMAWINTVSIKKYIKIHQTHIFLVACYATLHPALEVRWSVDPSVRPSHFIIFFFGFWDFGLYCSCQNDLWTSIKSPAHLHASGVAATLTLSVHLFPIWNIVEPREHSKAIIQNYQNLSCSLSKSFFHRASPVRPL